ncbi:MAG TPA: glycosyltransferase family 2 protein [Mesotoga infera]|uniref:Glycosyltransferase family 2 protein n=1 Tax=Mesotoga infera TaxID=1236046 RepID=A0A7C1GSZ1_9BACT|nr:glycosyltransferase family 2 protein [Mesotoga infera]
MNNRLSTSATAQEGLAVTVVVPAYNAERYIERTLKTIIAQQGVNFELIVVNDGSTDSTEDVASSVLGLSQNSATFSRIIRIENSGVSSARNTGLISARGEYMIFFDSDDLMSEDCLSSVYRKACETQADVLAFGFDVVDWSGRIVRRFEDRYEYLSKPTDGKTVLLLMMKNKTWLWTGSVLYKKSFLEEHTLKYQTGATNGEDVEFTMKALFCARRVVFLEKSLVQYIVRGDSASKASDYRHFHSIGSMKRLRKFLDVGGASNEIIEIMDSDIVPRTYFGAIGNLALGGFRTKDIIELINHPEILKQIKEFEPLTKKDRMLKSLLVYFPRMYVSYLRLRGMSFRNRRNYTKTAIHN